MWKRSHEIDLQPWPSAKRPRVLIEHPEPDRALDLVAAIRRRGCTVGVCRGPDAAGDPPTRCPLHDLEPCVAVEGADVVVTALDFDAYEARAVIEGLRTRYAGRPVIVLATVAQTLELGDVLEGCAVLPVDAEPGRVAEAVREVLPSQAGGHEAGATL